MGIVKNALIGFGTTMVALALFAQSHPYLTTFVIAGIIITVGMMSNNMFISLLLSFVVLFLSSFVGLILLYYICIMFILVMGLVAAKRAVIG